MILVDYTCGQCRGRHERWAPSPPPAQVPCLACGAQARRAWAPVGLSGARPSPPAEDATRSSAAKSAAAPLCTRYPQVPGLCHMSESAGRLWTARYFKDNRRVESELARQEAQAAVRTPTMADAVTHHHHNVAVPPAPAG